MKPSFGLNRKRKGWLNLWLLNIIKTELELNMGRIINLQTTGILMQTMEMNMQMCISGCLQKGMIILPTASQKKTERILIQILWKYLHL